MSEEGRKAEKRRHHDRLVSEREQVDHSHHFVRLQDGTVGVALRMTVVPSRRTEGRSF